MIKKSKKSFCFNNYDQARAAYIEMGGGGLKVGQRPPLEKGGSRVIPPPLFKRLT